METERQRDRETEKRRNKETERQRDRETCRWQPTRPSRKTAASRWLKSRDRIRWQAHVFDKGLGIRVKGYMHKRTGTHEPEPLNNTFGTVVRVSLFLCLSVPLSLCQHSQGFVTVLLGLGFACCKHANPNHAKPTPQDHTVVTNP